MLSQYHRCISALSQDHQVGWEGLVPGLQSLASVIVAILFGITLASRVTHDMLILLQGTPLHQWLIYLGHPARCYGDWSGVSFGLLLVLSYPAVYLILHSPENDIQMERGIGMFLSLTRSRYPKSKHRHQQKSAEKSE